MPIPNSSPARRQGNISDFAPEWGLLKPTLWKALAQTLRLPSGHLQPWERPTGSRPRHLHHESPPLRKKKSPQLPGALSLNQPIPNYLNHPGLRQRMPLLLKKKDRQLPPALLKRCWKPFQRPCHYPRKSRISPSNQRKKGLCEIFHKLLLRLLKPSSKTMPLTLTFRF